MYIACTKPTRNLMSATKFTLTRASNAADITELERLVNKEGWKIVGGPDDGVVLLSKEAE